MSEEGIITELQIGWGWNYLWKSSGPATQVDLVEPELVAQNHVQLSSEYLQAWILHRLPGQPVLLLSYPHSEKVFPDVQTSAPVFQFVPTASGSSTRHPRKSLSPSPLRPLFSHSYTLIRSF